MWSWTQVGNTKVRASVEGRKERKEGRKERRTMSNPLNNVKKERRTMSNPLNNVTTTEIFRG